ncbi:MAG: hypothetical protein LAN71_14460 [Acidobacteriia bacterium]|nr:hypothetical protein [Terriglobia bacterium]
MRAFYLLPLAAAALLFGPAPAEAAVPSVDPAQTVRGLLAAACEQNQAKFARYLPVRSARAYARLTEPSRVALMKRFSFLEAAGKAVSGEKSAVRCESPARTVEMEIGGAELQENLAFLPVDVRLSGAAQGNAPPRRVQIGLVLEGGAWKLLSAGLLLLDLPALELEWNRESLEANEHSTIATMQLLAQAVENYRRSYAHLPERIEQLGPPAHGAASAAAAGLLDAELAGGAKSGYRFRYVIVGASSQGAQARFELAAVPLAYGTTGQRSFFLDAQGMLHGADRRGALASEADASIAKQPAN